MGENMQHEVIRGLLPFLILKYGQRKDFHGYELILMFRREFKVYFGPATIYPLLADMVKEGLLARLGWVTRAKGRPVILYRITANGLDEIPSSEATLLSVIQHMIGKNDLEIEKPEQMRTAPFWVMTLDRRI